MRPTPGDEFSFLGITLELTSVGLLLHQRAYTEAFLEEYKDVTPRRKTTREPEHYDKDAKSPPDTSNPEHVEWVKRAQKILGALLWLSTCNQLGCSISLGQPGSPQDQIETSSSISQHRKDLRSSVHLSTEGAAINSFRDHHLCRFITCSCWKRITDRICFLLSFGNVRHLINWHSTREKKIAESSAEAELYALSTSFKTARNFRLLIHETLATEVITNMRCDNMAALAMIDEPSWRTRCTSIYGKSLRQEVLKKRVIITYVTIDLQLADPLIKPTSTKINVHLLPLLGLKTCNFITTLALQESAWSITLHSAADLLRKVLYSRLTTNIRFNNKNWRAEALLVYSAHM